MNGLRSTSHDARRAPSLSQLGHAVGVHEDPSPLDGATKPSTSGGSAPPDRGEHDVVEPADGGAIGVEQGQAHHPERVDELASHVRKATSAPQASLRRRTTEGAAAATAKPAIIAPASWRERRTAAVMSPAVGTRPRAERGPLLDLVAVAVDAAQAEIERGGEGGLDHTGVG